MLTSDPDGMMANSRDWLRSSVTGYHGWSHVSWASATTPRLNSAVSPVYEFWVENAVTSVSSSRASM